MKKLFSVILLCMMVFAFSACGTSDSESLITSTPESSPSETEPSSIVEQSEPAESTEESSTTEDVEEPENISRQISVQFGENTAIYELRRSFIRRRSWRPAIRRWRRQGQGRWLTMSPGEMWYSFTETTTKTRPCLS